MFDLDCVKIEKSVKHFFHVKKCHRAFSFCLTIQHFGYQYFSSHEVILACIVSLAMHNASVLHSIVNRITNAHSVIALTHSDN